MSDLGRPAVRRTCRRLRQRQNPREIARVLANAIACAVAFGGAQALNYFRELLIDENMPLRFVPKPLTAAMIARAIPAAIKPYSIAVAPELSDRNLRKHRFKAASCEMCRFDPTAVFLRETT